MNRAVLGVDAGPAALGLERAVRRLESGPVRAGADAVRHLIEAVAQSLGPDLDRLEKNVVFGIARHKLCPPSCYAVRLVLFRRVKVAAHSAPNLEQRGVEIV